MLLALFALAPLTLGQPAPFTMRVQQPDAVSYIPEGGTLTMAADAVGVPTGATVTVTYIGTSSAAFNIVDLSGSTDFSLTPPPEIAAGSVTLLRNQSLSFVLRFLPTSSSKQSGKVTINCLEGGRMTFNFGFSLVGTAPEFAYSYVPQAGNATVVGPGATMTMALTPVNTTSNTTVIVTNRGSGAGVVNSIALSGAAFQLVGVPLPKTTVEAGKDLKFALSFTPKQLELSAGSLQIELIDRKVTFNLEGLGSGPTWAYESIQESTISALLPNQTITLADAALTEKSTITVRFRNTGNAEGKITVISVSGAGFTLSDAPFMPLTMPIGASATLTVTFTPTQSGRVTGRLRIGDDNFEIAGTGLGSVLTYAYAIGQVSTTVLANGTVVFTPVPVGRTSNVQFTVSNTGTAQATLSSVSIISTTTVFTLTDVPGLPLVVQPGATVSFGVGFTPTVLGNATATLKIDTLSFTLSGTGNQPVALPDYRVEGPTTAQDAMQQPAIGLTLASPYPLALTGTLTLTFSSEVFSNDPAVQFAPGGRTINFIIPANGTRAVFPNNATQVRIQTGTVAGTITLTPSFATQEGNINLTPVNPPSLNVAVARSAPRILSVAISNKTSSSFTVQVTGYATSRSVTQMDLQFTPVADEVVQTTKLSIPAAAASFIAWFNSTQSQAFGSMFTASIPLSFSGDVVNVTNLVDTIQSVVVSIGNELGTAPARSVDVR